MATKKDKKDKDIEETSEPIEMESAEKNVPETDSGSGEEEAVGTDISPRDEVDVISDVTDDSVESESTAEEEISADDLLDDVRRSLIEENVDVKKEKKPGWWQKIGIGARKGKKSEEIIPSIGIQEDSDTGGSESVSDQQEEVGESIDELIGMLEKENKEEPLGRDLTPVVHVKQQAPETEKVDVNELKKRAFKGSASDDKEESFSDVREVALDGGEDVFVEVEIKPVDQVDDRLKSFENALRPYRRYIYFAITFIGIVVIVITSALLYDAYKRTLPPGPVQEAEALPYPVVINVPGGLSFNLGRGTLNKGRWDPRRPEWLEGTEICRWVAIPYSRQLEAVVRTLTQDDQLELVMSNNDRWSYNVYSVTRMSIEDMQKVSSNSSCLLLVLADVSTDTRWVVTAYP